MPLQFVMQVNLTVPSHMNGLKLQAYLNQLCENNDSLRDRLENLLFQAIWKPDRGDSPLAVDCHGWQLVTIGVEVARLFPHAYEKSGRAAIDIPAIYLREGEIEASVRPGPMNRWLLYLTPCNLHNDRLVEIITEMKMKGDKVRVR